MDNDGTSALAIIEQPRMQLIPNEQTTNSAYALAKLAASSGLCKTKKPEDAFFVIMHGYEIGIPAMTALRTIHIINGVPVTSGEALLAIIRRSGKVEIKITGDAQQATVYMKRKDSGEEYKAHWTIERAAIAGLTGKTTWKNFPQAFLQWRGVGECSKFLCSDITNGLYPAEEIAPDLNYDESGSVIEGQTITVSKLPEPIPAPVEIPWHDVPDNLNRLAHRAFERQWITQTGDAGIKELAIIIEPKRWEDFDTCTAAGLAIKEICEDIEAELAAQKESEIVLPTAADLIALSPVTEAPKEIPHIPTDDALKLLNGNHGRKELPALDIPKKASEPAITDPEAVKLVTGGKSPFAVTPDKDAEKALADLEQ